MIEIRLATAEDVPSLPAIERAAFALFEQTAATTFLPLRLTPLEDLAEAQRQRLLWVAEAAPGGLVGFALARLLDGVLHLEELDVLPAYGRQGIGTRLVRTLCSRARDRGLTAVTLCTFRDVPWNAPFYQRLGFRTLGEDQLTSGLAAKVREEELAGLPRDQRVAMRLDLPPFSFRAFISYSRKDQKTAIWLHRHLEAYRMPAELVGKITDLGPVPAVLGKFFRDEDELKGEMDLGLVIRKALEKSQHLIVLCSPDSARSSWVNKEIQEFKRLGREERILPLILAGAPHDPTQECFPPALIKKLAAEGRPADETVEPIAFNLREGGRRRGLVNVVASLTGLDFDELWKRQQRRTRQRRMLAALGLIAALGVAGSLLLYVRQKGELERTLALSAEAMNAKRWDLAAAAAAVSLQPKPVRWIDVSSAAERLKRLRGAGRTQALMLGHKKSVTAAVLLDEGEAVATSSLDTTVHLWHGSIGHEIANGVSQVKRIRVSRDSRKLAAASDWALTVVEPKTGKVLLDWMKPRESAMIKDLAFSRGGSLLVATSDGKLIELRGPGYDEAALLFDGTASIETLAISPSGTRAAFGDDEGNLYFLDMVEGRSLPGRDVTRGAAHSSYVNHVTFGLSDDLVLSSSNDTEARITVLSSSGRRAPTWFTLRDLSVGYSEIAPSGGSALSILTPSAVVLWSTESGDVIAELTVPGCKQDEPFNPSCQGTHACFRPGLHGEPDQIIVGYRDGALRLWSSTGALQGELPGHVGPITNLDVSRDGSLLVSAAEDGSARLWRLNGSPGKAGANLHGKFCQETDPLLLRYDAPHNWDPPLNYKVDHNSAALSSLMGEARVVDPCRQPRGAAR